MSEEDIDCQWAGEAGQESTVGQGWMIQESRGVRYTLNALRSLGGL